MNRLPKLLLLLILVSPGCTVTPVDDDERQLTQAIGDWNQLVLSLAEAEDGFWTLKGLRTVTMMHLAIHDAINATDKRFDSYLSDRQVPETDAGIAASAAAYAVAAAQYPDKASRMTALRDQFSNAAPEPVRARSTKLGETIATEIMRARNDDGWQAEPAYQWHPMAPGVYAEFNEHSGTPEGFIFGSGLALTQPFVLNSPAEFRSPPPPAINSVEYADAFDEVRELGRRRSDRRTSDQTHLALWWKDFAENSHNRLARRLIADENLDPHRAARLFALINMSIFDAYVGSFDSKFYYNHWRPYTAIRWAANDGNEATAAEVNWTNTHNHTYPFPSYPSAHGTACTAAMTALADTFGDEYAFAMLTATVDSGGAFSPKLKMEPANRNFERFSDAAMECSLSRIYLGIHFRYDSLEGNRLGRRIGRAVVKRLPATR